METSLVYIHNSNDSLIKETIYFITIFILFWVVKEGKDGVYDSKKMKKNW